MKKDEKNELTIKYLESLKLSDWTYDKRGAGGGGQATGLCVTHSNGSKGVFRLAHCNSQEAKERFKRELNILTSARFSHPNIIEILDYTKNPDIEHWYISRLGETLHSYWSDYLESESDANERVLKAIQIVLALLQGLDVCHRNNPQIIHRDIKSRNVVLVNDVPKLIDFGIAYDEGQEDITPINAGNLAANRKAPDMQLYRGADKLPWYDVYLMAQLLIWMVCEHPLKSWERPLNWRFVVFPTDISPSNVLKLKSIFALCSMPELAPRNAAELSTLIGGVFTQVNTKVNVMKTTFDIDKINEVIAEVKAVENSSKVLDFELFEALLPSFTIHIDNLREHFKVLAGSLGGLNVVLLEQSTIEEWAARVRSSLQTKPDLVTTNLLKLCVKETGGFQVQLTFFPTVYLKERKDFGLTEHFMRAICIIDFGGDYRENNRKSFQQIMAFKSISDVVLFSSSYSKLCESTIDKVKEDIAEFINDEELWKYLK